MREIRKSRRGTCLNRIAHAMLVQIKNRSKVRLKECHAQVVRSGLRGDSDFHSRSAEVKTGLSAPHLSYLAAAAISCRRASAALPIQQLDALAIQQNFQLFAWNGAKALRRHVVAEYRSDRDLIFGIRRKDVPDQHSTASSERQSFNVVIL